MCGKVARSVERIRRLYYISLKRTILLIFVLYFYYIVCPLEKLEIANECHIKYRKFKGMS